ncbi:hypothetical protein Cfor_12069 [Coptotermes formosanus]|uniref:Uncharacterized protein n=1 Tax=Coptotermes formosanus TaxID=36987 RepID=A0A6L2PQC5_COPFO|nr:hypothetical protein Cfor_12069 [Coptotermes formosanus]
MEEARAMKRVYLSSPNVTCNDGSPAGFYLRRSHGSRRWVVFLEGGWYCYDQPSCHSRWQRLRHLMTSRHWPETRSAGGILSMNPEENAFWWNANHVLVPYCTSDSWSGTRAESNGEVPFSFMGAAVVRQVVEDLLPLGLRNASLLLLAGSSAGGTGVMVNLDPVADLLNTAYGLSHITVRGVSDSGWFLDRTPYSKDGNSLAPLDAIKKGIGLWQGKSYNESVLAATQICDRVLNSFSTNSPSTHFVVVTPTQASKMFYRVDNTIQHKTLQQNRAVFAPSCISHSVLTKNDWQSIKIDEISLPQALRCWEMSHPRHNGTVPTDGPLALKVGRHMVRSGDGTTVVPPLRRRKGKKKKGVNARVHRDLVRCPHHLIERCSWPQCNHSCPRLTNPFTGQEMDFIELLKSFGLDMMSVANALGIDIHTLNNMDHEELLNLLTQRAK